MAQGMHQGTGSSGLADTASDLKNKAADQMDKVANQVEAKARAAREQGREVGEQVQVVAGNFKTALDKSIREQPITTLALTAAVAFVIGAIWKS